MKVEKHKRFRIQLLVAIGVAVSSLVSSCGNPSQQSTSASINIDGSSTVYPITEKAVGEFKDSYNQPVDITLAISGTGGGFEKFCRGDTQISNASRPIQAEEMDLCLQNGVSFIELPIAFDALTVVVNAENDWVESLTIEDLKKIWEPAAEGKITSWSQVNSDFPDRPLNLFGPDVESGTFDYFTEAVMGTAGESRTDYVSSEDDNLIVQGVRQDPNAMGYFGLSYYEGNPDQLKAIAIDSGNGAIAPSKETVERSAYQPLARPLFIYINAKAAQDNIALQEFIDFYLDNADALVRSANYIPLTEESYHINKVTFHRGEAGTVFAGQSQFDITIPELQRKQAELPIEPN